MRAYGDWLRSYPPVRGSISPAVEAIFVGQHFAHEWPRPGLPNPLNVRSLAPMPGALGYALAG